MDNMYNRCEWNNELCRLIYIFLDLRGWCGAVRLWGCGGIESEGPFLFLPLFFQLIFERVEDVMLLVGSLYFSTFSSPKNKTKT